MFIQKSKYKKTLLMGFKLTNNGDKTTRPTHNLSKHNHQSN